MICSLEVDLSKELTAPSKTVLEQQIEAPQVREWFLGSLSGFFFLEVVSKHPSFNNMIVRGVAAQHVDGNWYQHGVNKRNGIEQLKLLLEAV